MEYTVAEVIKKALGFPSTDKYGIRTKLISKGTGLRFAGFGVAQE